MSDGKNLTDNSNSNDGGGDDDNDRDGDNQAINSPNYAAPAAAAADDNDDEGMPRKTLVIATIWRKMDAANANIPEGGALDRPTTKLRQYLSLTVNASAPTRSGSS